MPVVGDAVDARFRDDLAGFESLSPSPLPCYVYVSTPIWLYGIPTRERQFTWTKNLGGNAPSEVLY